LETNEESSVYNYLSVLVITRPFLDSAGKKKTKRRATATQPNEDRDVALRPRPQAQEV